MGRNAEAQREADEGASVVALPGVLQKPRLRGYVTALLMLVLIVAAGAVAVGLGQDANWDLQNYHYYNAWAWWHGRIFTKDLAAAQVQTFLNPVLDLPFYWMVTAEWAPRVIAFVMAIPAGIAAFFLCKLLLLMFGGLPLEQ